MRNTLCRRAAFLFIIGIAALISSGCANQQRYFGNGPTLSPQEIQLGDMCEKYSDLTPGSPTAYAECYNNPALLYPKLPSILGKLSGHDLCALPTPEGKITNEINHSIKKRKVDCAKIAREEKIKAIKAEDTPSLCQAWSSRSAGDFQHIVDAEVKKRGVRCELILSQIQQQQMFQQQQLQQQEMFRQQQLQQAIQANQQAQIQRQQNMLLQQQIMQQNFRSATVNNSIHCSTMPGGAPGYSNTNCY